MSLFAGQKRELEDDSGQSANFKKLKSDLGTLFGLGFGSGSSTLVPQHNTVVSFRELTILDDKVCMCHLGEYTHMCGVGGIFILLLQLKQLHLISITT
jgi:hypothetical protein